MPSTIQAIDWLQMNVEGWDRDGVRGILPILNELHRILFQNETEQTLKFDAVNGEFPFIPTIENVFEYELPADVWRVTEVLLPSPINTDYGRRFLLPDYNFVKHIRRVDEKIYFHKRYSRLPNITTVDKTRGSNCKIRFHDNPGDKIESVEEGTNTSTATQKLIDSAATFVTNLVKVGMAVTNNTDETIAIVTAIDSETQLALDRDIFTATSKTYKVGNGEVLYRGFLVPTNLTSEAINMDGSEDTHLNVIMPAAIAVMEDFENGGWREGTRIVNEYKEEMVQNQSSGDQGLTYRTQRVEE